MSYGKYGFKNNGGNANIDSFVGRAWNDPWFALGELLAKNYNQNYEERGIGKEQDNWNKILAAANSPENMASNMEILNKMEKDGAFKTLGEGKPFNIATPMDAAQMAASKGLDTPQGRAVAENSYMNNPQNFQGSGLFNNFAQNNIAANSKQNDALKTVGAVPTDTKAIAGGVMEKYPTAEEIAKIASKNNIDYRLMNEGLEKVKADFVSDMRKRGRPQSQINAVLGIIDPDLQRLKARETELKTEDILSRVKGVDFSKGYSPELLQTIIKLAPINPVAAEILRGNMITGKEQWASNNVKENAKMQFGYQQAGEDARLGRAKSFAGYTSGLKVANNDGQKEAKETYDMALNISKEADRKREQDPNYIPTENEKRAQSYVNSYREYKLRGSSNPQPNQTVDFNNYNQVINWASGLLGQGYSKNDIVKAIRTKMGESDFSNNILAHLGLAPQVQKSQPVLDKLIADTEKAIETNKSLEQERRRQMVTEAQSAGFYVGRYGKEILPLHPYTESPNTPDSKRKMEKFKEFKAKYGDLM